MGKYILRRVLFALFSLLVVVMTVMLLVYSLIDRRVIFMADDVWNKRSNNEQAYYEYVQFQKYGYLEFVNYTNFLAQKYQAIYGDSYTKEQSFNTDRDAVQYENWRENASVQEFISTYEAKGYKVTYLEPIRYKDGRLKSGGTGFLLMTRERSVLLRLWDYLKGLITIETVRDVKDPELTDRYIRIEKDPYNGFFTLVGSGTTHKYLVYFDGRFPFMHWHWIHINLGVSFTKYRDQEITSVITTPTGNLATRLTQYPAFVGTDRYDETAIDFYSLTYNNGTLTDQEKELYPDKYTVGKYKRDGFSMLENSFVIGIIATIIAYMVGLPLGIINARNKDKLADKIGMGYIIFTLSVPALAYIFLFSAIGTKVFNLPYTFANAQVKILAYILPVASLAVREIAGLMMWMRRFMIDQMNSDYVKFARAEGLSEREIFGKHISRNAVIPIVHGIPGSILACLVGAIITERVYSVPGVGNLLTTAINGHDNGIIVACAMFYTSLSVISVILGDLLMAKFDPRISFTTKGGR